MPYPTWARPSKDFVCCLVRKLSEGKEARQTFLRCHWMQQIQAGAHKLGDADNAVPALHEPPTYAMAASQLGVEHNARWVKECEVELPAGFAITAMCPEGCIIISVVGSGLRALEHFDTKTGRLQEIMHAGQPDDDPSEICLEWVPAGRQDVARFLYVATLGNRIVVLVEAHQHLVL